MDCSPCGGLMVPVELEDRESTYIRCSGIRCLACGDILDPLIAYHRSSTVTSRLQNGSELAGYDDEP